MSARLFLTNSVNQHLDEFAPEIEQQIKDLLLRLKKENRSKFNVDF